MPRSINRGARCQPTAWSWFPNKIWWLWSRSKIELIRICSATIAIIHNMSPIFNKTIRNCCRHKSIKHRNSKTCAESIIIELMLIRPSISSTSLRCETELTNLSRRWSGSTNKPISTRSYGTKSRCSMKNTRLEWAKSRLLWNESCQAQTKTSQTALNSKWIG